MGLRVIHKRRSQTALTSTSVADLEEEVSAPQALVRKQFVLGELYFAAALTVTSAGI
jgi:hypothetical protein